MAASYARGVLVSKSLTLPKGVHDGFLPVNKKIAAEQSRAAAREAQGQKVQAKHLARQTGKKRSRLGDRPDASATSVAVLGSGICAVEAVLQLIGCETEPREAAALLGVVPGVPEAPADILCRMRLDIPQLALLGGALNPDGQLVVAMEAVPPSWSSLVVEGQQLPSLLVLADTQEAMFFQRTGVVLADQGHMRF